MTFFNYDVYRPLTKSLFEHSVTFWKDVISSFWLSFPSETLFHTAGLIVYFGWWYPWERERGRQRQREWERETESWSNTVVKNVLKSSNIFIPVPKSFSMKVVVAGTSCRIYAITDSLISQSSCNIMPVVQISFP